MKYLWLTFLCIATVSAQLRKSGSYSNAGNIIGGSTGYGGHHRGVRSLVSSSYSTAGVRNGVLASATISTRHTSNSGQRLGRSTSVPADTGNISARHFPGGYDRNNGQDGHKHRLVEGYGHHEAASYSGAGLDASHGAIFSGTGHLRGDTGYLHV